MTPHPHHHSPGTEANWLDALLHNVAQETEPDDAGFSEAVLRALPPPAACVYVGAGVQWVNVCALAAASALLTWLLPSVVDQLAVGTASEFASNEALEHLLPSIALVAWMAWWSLQCAFED